MYNQIQHQHHCYHEYCCFLHHFKWQMKTRRTTNVQNFSPTIFTENVFRTELGFSLRLLWTSKPNKRTPSTHILYIQTDQQSKCKQKVLLLIIVFIFISVLFQNNAYLNPDWEKSHWFSTRCLKKLKGWAREGAVCLSGVHHLSPTDWTTEDYLK